MSHLMQLVQKQEAARLAAQRQPDPRRTDRPYLQMDTDVLIDAINAERRADIRHALIAELYARETR